MIRVYQEVQLKPGYIDTTAAGVALVHPIPNNRLDAKFNEITRKFNAISCLVSMEVYIYAVSGWSDCRRPAKSCKCAFLETQVAL